MFDDRCTISGRERISLMTSGIPIVFRVSALISVEERNASSLDLFRGHFQFLGRPHNDDHHSPLRFAAPPPIFTSCYKKLIRTRTGQLAISASLHSDSVVAVIYGLQLKMNIDCFSAAFLSPYSL